MIKTQVLILNFDLKIWIVRVQIIKYGLKTRVRMKV